MISNLDPTSELFLSNVERIQQRVADASRQVSSGQKIAQPSDAPDQIDSILQLRAEQQRITQIQSNLTVERTRAQSADGALTSAIKLLDRARVLSAQGATGTVDPAGRKAIAQEVRSLFDEMIACSRTSVEGRFVFSGDADNTPPYQADSTSLTGAAQLTTAAATRRIQDPAGGSFASGKTAREIFDSRNLADGSPAADNVFAALNGLETALLAGDQTAIAQTSTMIQAASEQLNISQSFYGALQGRLTDAQAFADRAEIELKTELSQKEDADIVGAALALSQGNTQLQAAFQMRAAMPHKSLFDFIG
jgi:flagellar hook-associated protein 3 FlgL